MLFKFYTKSIFIIYLHSELHDKKRHGKTNIKHLTSITEQLKNKNAVVKQLKSRFQDLSLQNLLNIIFDTVSVISGFKYRSNTLSFLSANRSSL